MSAHSPKLLIATLCLAITLGFTGRAFAARPHEFTSTFGEPCAAEPCEGAALKEPDGVAVSEAGGEVYVVDKGADRLVRFSAAGAFQAEVSGPSATGTANLSEGSSTIEAAVATTGAFSVGEEVSAAGLPAGTRITAVNGASLELSQAATATEPFAALSASERFAEPETIAVDNSCVLLGLGEPRCKVADPSSGDVYVVDAGHRVIDKFSAAGEFIGQITKAGAIELSSFALDGVAVDREGGLWVYREEPAVIDGFTNGQPNEFTGQIEASIFVSGTAGFAAPGGFAVDSQGNFYGNLFVHHRQITKWNHTGGVLIEELGSEDSSAVAVDQRIDSAFVDNLTSVGVFNAEGAELERLGEEHGEAHLSEGAGIGVNAATSTLFVADAAAGRVVVFGPAQPSTPKVEGESFSRVGSDRASLAGEVNPRSEPGEGPTSYRFQYGPCATATTCASSAYQDVPGSAGTLAADFGVHPVTAKLEGLIAGTTYHFRVVAENEHGEGEPGEEQTFTTETAGGELVLPDHRGWELVSPPDKQGALIAPIAESGVIQAAGDGTAITYLANSPTETQPQGAANSAQVLSSRGTAAWSSRDISIPHVTATGAPFGEGPEYKFFTPDLGESAVQPFGEFEPGLSAEASESTAFLHDLTGSCGSSCYRPLVTGKPGFANVPEGTVFGEQELCTVIPERKARTTCGPQFLGATEDLSHVVVRSASAALTPGGVAGSLTEWAGGLLAPVSVLQGPEGETVAGELGLSGQARRAISSDGARVVWSTSAALYQRDTVRGETVELDPRQAGCGGCESGGGRFQIASADGSRVFFSDERRLTSDSGAANGGDHKADLYECRIVLEAGHLVCELSDLTPQSGGESANVQGSVLGASEDGSLLYFVAKGVLSEAANTRGQKAQAGQANLYVRHGAGTEFIATLSGEDAHDWNGVLRGQPTRVSANGRWLELMSAGSPTGYDNRDRASGRPTAEVYLYDASAGRLTCASCEPSGERPSGVEYFKLEPGSGGLVGGGRGTWVSSGLVAANVPGWTAIDENPTSRHQPRYLSDTGRLFFNTADALVPQDSNSTQDVYQYEPPGVGDCSEPLPTYSARSGGCVSLISSGGSSQESAFLDASESGDDVFFLTSAKLSPLDRDAARDVYDAHLCTSASPCISFEEAKTQPCASEASCKAPPTPQPSIFGAPASATITGAGNLTPPPPAIVKPPAETRARKLAKALRACRRKHGVKHRACVRQARKRYGAKHGVKRSSHAANGRAKTKRFMW